MAYATLSTLPIYHQDKPEQPGLYLGLLHGRNHPETDMDNWGFNDPLIGPLHFVHTTYQSHIKLEFANQADISKYGLDPAFTVLEIEDDMVYFDNAWYGGWTVFYHQNDSRGTHHG